MLVRALYLTAYVACILIPLLVGGGVGILSDPRAQFAVAFGIAWAIVESSIQPRQFARRWSDLAWITATVLGIASAFTITVFQYVYFREMTAQDDWIMMVGFGLALAGLIVRLVAIQTLGEFFSHELKISQNHRIVRNGLYRYLRHPSYTGFAMICLGVPLAFGAMQVFAATLVAIAIALAVRILLEERILLNHFGDEYRAYQQCTKRLIPFVL